MNELSNRLREDIAVARSLAEEGRKAPLIGGAYYVVWGAAICACMLFNWAVSGGLLNVSPWSIPAVWFGGMTAAHLLTRTFSAKLARLPGAAGIGNTVSAAVWRALGLFLGLFATTLFLALFRAPEWMFGAKAGDGRIFAAAYSIFLPVSFGAYSMALAATAAAAKSKLLNGFSWLSLLIMIAVLALIGRSEQMLVGAAGILLVSVLPGLLLMRRAPLMPAHEHE